VATRKQNKQPRKLPLTLCRHVRQNDNSTGDDIVSDNIGLSFVYLICLRFFVLCYFVFVISMHCIELSLASHVLIFKSTYKLQVKLETSNLSYDF
jgi:hypothetical protein